MRHIARRPAYPRAALLLLALLSMVSLGGAQSVSCEMHGLGASHGIATDDTVKAVHAGMAGMSHDSGQTGGANEHGDCHCSCIGDCSIVAPLATAPVATTIRVALVTPEPRRPIVAEPTRAPPPEPDRLLPFANGPPASALL